MRTAPDLGVFALAVVAGCYGTAGPTSTIANPVDAAPSVASTRRAQPAIAMIELDSFGIAELTPAEGSPVDALHVRFLLTNPESLLPWRLEPDAIRIDLAGKGEAYARFANADVPTLPIVLVEPNARVLLDVYFPVPPGVTEVDSFTVTAEIATPDRRFEWRGRFDPRTPTLARVRGGIAAGSGAYWWSDPTFAWSSFHRRPGIATHRPPAQIAVTRQPPGLRLR